MRVYYIRDRDLNEEREEIIMKNRNLLLEVVLLVTLAFFASCDLFNGGGQSNERILINNNAGDLSSRVIIKDDILPFYGVDGATLNKISADDSSDFVLVLRAEVEAPIYDGMELRASHVTIENGYAYVAYNREGEGYLGGVEVFDVSDVRNPQLVSQAIFTDTDISAVIYKDGALYLAEAVSPYLNDAFNTPAVLEKMTLSAGLLTTNTIQKDLSSYVATDVNASDNKIFVTTGSDGHVFVIEPDSLGIDTLFALSDARSIDVEGDKVAVLSASPFMLSVYDQADYSFNSYSVGGLTIPESKSEVELDGNYAYVTLNDGGLKVIDITTGDVLDQMARPETAPGGDDIDYVTNSVSINEELVLIANGAAGVWVGKKYDGDPIDIYGSMEFQSSTNFVEGKDDVVFVATGFGGFRILEVLRYDPEEGDYLNLGDWDSNGLPDYLEAEIDTVDTNLLNDIDEALPEYERAPNAHPEYFDTTATGVEMSEEADLYVTFIMEGAGWTNSLGFYTFDPANPPATPEDITNLTVIFPNVSQEGSGGSLIPGHTVHLGKFPAGTAVGFFLVSKGWHYGTMTSGIYTHYSNYEFNNQSEPQLLQHNVLLNDSTRAQLILAFEDIDRGSSGCDEDFNDAVFTVKSVPENAYFIDTMPIIGN